MKKQILKNKLINQIKSLSLNWQKFFWHISKQKWWIQLIDQLAELYLTQNISPNIEQLFYAFKLTPIENMKVVIVGQDPYPTPNTANGLAFWIPQNTTYINPSFKNILKKLAQEYNTDLNELEYLDLTIWAFQGVFLFNATLSVQINYPNSHQKIWQQFSQNVLKFCQIQNPNLIYVGWGKFAQNQILNLKPNKKQLIFSSHPSPLAAHISFFSTPIFTKINQLLINQKQKPINWLSLNAF